MAKFLNKNVKFLRNSKNISQQELSNITGIDRSIISRIENGEIETSIDNAIKIAEAFNISLQDLVVNDISQSNENYIINSEEKYIQILKEQGLMNQNGEIDCDVFEKLINFAVANKDYIIDKK